MQGGIKRGLDTEVTPLNAIYKHPSPASFADTESDLILSVDAEVCPAGVVRTMADRTSLLSSSVMDEVRLRAQDTPSCASGTNGVSRRDHDPNADHRNLVEVIISTLGSHRTSARVSYLSVSDRCPYANLRDCPGCRPLEQVCETAKTASVLQTEASSGVDFAAWCRPGNLTPAPTPNRTCEFPSIRLSRLS